MTTINIPILMFVSSAPFIVLMVAVTVWLLFRLARAAFTLWESLPFQ